MKISICIPQYNRCGILLQNLRRIEQQTYPDVEIIISDDGSTDDTVERISELQKLYKYPIRLHVNERNEGFDRNYRRSVELATGEYAIVIGNDDTLNDPTDIEYLVAFLREQDYPEIGYCNYVEHAFPETIVEKVRDTGVKGSGIEVALQYYNGFSFIGGVIYKKSTFEKFNTGKHDGSIYGQMYLGLLMIASGCRFFTIYRPLIVKNIEDAQGQEAWSYVKHGLPKRWSEFRKMDGGLPAVSQVLISAIQDALGNENRQLAYRIIKRVYSVTFPYWVIQYKKHGSLAASMGLIQGLFPPGTRIWNTMNGWGKIRIMITYVLTALAGLLFPSQWFNSLESRLRALTKQ